MTAIRDRIVWGPQNPLSDPRLADLDKWVNSIWAGKIPPNVQDRGVFLNRKEDLPPKPDNYYSEYSVKDAASGKGGWPAAALVLGQGKGGEVYITGDHYGDRGVGFRQIIGIPVQSLNEKAARALVLLKDLKARLQREVERVADEHSMAADNLETGGGGLINAFAAEMGRLVVDRFDPLPPLTIWGKPLGRLQAAQRALWTGDLTTAFNELVLGRRAYLVALKQFVTWKNGLDAAGKSAETAIVVTAIGVALAAVGAWVALGADMGALGSAGGLAATQQATLRIAAEVAADEARIRIATAGELEAEAFEEQRLAQTIEELGRLRNF